MATNLGRAGTKHHERHRSVVRPEIEHALACHDRADDCAVEEIPASGAAVGGRDLSDRQPAAKIDRRVVAVARRDVGLETTQRPPRIRLCQQRSSEAFVERATIGIALRKEPGAARRVATDAGHRGKPRAASRNAHDAIERVPHAADAGRVRARHHIFGVFGVSRVRAHLTQADKQPRFPRRCMCDLFACPFPGTTEHSTTQR